MVSYVSQTGVWEIIVGETTLPHITIENLPADSTLKVTCQFFGRSSSDDLIEGYTYRIQEGTANLITLTPDSGLVQGSDSWQLYTHVLLFQAPRGTDSKDLTINVHLDSGDMNGRGVMMNFVLLAEIVA